MGELDETGAPLPGDAGASSLTGRQVGRYLVGPRLGSGGVADVYQAFDQVLGRSVALKILPFGADERTYSRFRREALTAGALHHPHIVRILQVGGAQSGGLAYIAMELVQGESLAAMLTRCGLLNPAESCNLLEPIARALAAAHRAGTIHRDVKPGNILLQPASPGAPYSVQLESLDHPVVPLLTDFGIARSLDSPELTSAGRTVGTPAFMAPEQCAGSSAIDGRADIYALGAVLYRCVTGRLPFNGSTTQILYAHVYEPLVIEDHLLRQLSPIVVDILKRSLAKRPQDRYADADQMAADMALAAGRRPPPVHAAGGAAGDHSSATATLTVGSLPALIDEPVSTAATTVLVAPAPSARTASSLGMTAPGSAQRTVTRPTRPHRRWSALMAAGVVGALGVVLIGFMLVRPLAGRLGLGQVAPTDSAPDVAAPNGPSSDAVGLRLTWVPDPTAPPATGSPAAHTPVAAPAVLVLPTLVATEPTAAATEQRAAAPESTWTLTPAPTATWTPAPTSTSTSTPTPTSTPMSTSTPTSTPTPTPTSTPAPPAIPNPAPGATANDSVVTACANTVHDFFSGFVAELDEDRRNDFLCPTGTGLETAAVYLLFEHGFMLQLDGSPLILVHYSTTGEWEQLAETSEGGEPGSGSEAPPTGSGLFLPAGAFGQAWQDERRSAVLGYATVPDAAPFSAVQQSFPGGLLIGNQDDGSVYAFLRERLRL